MFWLCRKELPGPIILQEACTKPGGLSRIGIQQIGNCVWAWLVCMGNSFVLFWLVNKLYLYGGQYL